MREVMDRCGINSVGKNTCGINWSVTKIGNTRQQRMSGSEEIRKYRTDFEGHPFLYAVV